VTEPKTPLDQALDLFVYLPVGLALTAREQLPHVIDKGRKRVASEVTMARAVGQFAVTMGQKEAEKALRTATSRLVAPPGAGRPGPRPGPSYETGSGRSSTSAPSRGDGAGVANGSASAATANGQSARPNGQAAPPVASLAIPGYDTLSASQVVQRLAGLAPAELEAVRSYEAATRQRRTILTKVAQLQGGAPG
jgi:hypothetical protein